MSQFYSINSSASSRECHEYAPELFTKESWNLGDIFPDAVECVGFTASSCADVRVINAHFLVHPGTVMDNF